METKNKIIEKITIDKEILSTFPKNNKKNTEIYLQELDKTIERYDEVKKNIIEQLKKRYNKLLVFTPNEELPIVKKELAELEYKIILLNKINSPYEKTGLDKIVYDISKYYKGSLIKVNTDILAAVRVFESVGIKLTKTDFTYSSFASEYMEVFFEEMYDLNSEKLKHTFEKIYWKKPNIIKHIQLNFRQLYYKYIDNFEEYCENQKRLFSTTEDIDSMAVYESYRNSMEYFERLNNESEYLFLNKFKNKELDVANYNDKKITDLYKVFTDVKEINGINNSIIKFNDTLKEYKNYFKYKFIIDDIKTMSLSKEKETITSKSKLKDIKKIEQSLESVNGKKSVFQVFNKKKFDIDKMIEDLMTLYNELDEAIFKEKIAEYINEDSRIIDLLTLASAYYIYSARLLKAQTPEITDEAIFELTESLRNFLLGNHTLISNLNAFTEYDIAMIISDKYKLDNLKVTMEMLKRESLDSLIAQTNQLIIYYHLTNLKDLTIAQVEEHLKIEKKLNEELLKNS